MFFRAFEFKVMDFCYGLLCMGVLSFKGCKDLSATTPEPPKTLTLKP